MSFLTGQSTAAKQRDASITSNTNAVQGIAEDAGNRGQKAFKFFKQSLVPAKDFWTTLLNGDTNALTSMLEPEINNINQQYDNQQQALDTFTPRGGSRASGNTQLATERANAVTNLFNRARPMAAEQLANIGNVFGNQSLGQTGVATNAYGQASSNLFGLNQEEEQRKARAAQFWGSLGGAAGNLAGMWATGGLGGSKGGGGG